MTDPDDLRDAFYRLERRDEETVEACARVICACVESALQRDASESSDERRLKRFINEHYAEPLTLSSVASALSMSKSKLCKLASAQGTSVSRLLAERRMDEAARLLRHSRLSVTEIAQRVGAENGNRLAKQFKRHMGQTPGDYRARRNRDPR